ncbi:MAG: helix-turn-helix domain-containing protein [Bacteroidales bacterium]|jgi:AraC-like DNA-binding protein|nr:helix-turn-helix domain-containing protein [Bacteroidales bacterium]
MKEIIYLDKISQYNEIKGTKTLHPLVSIIDNHKKPLPNGKIHFGLYGIFLKDVKCGELKYGRSKYDYEEGTLVFIGPGQVIEINNKEDYRPKGWALLFHPDLIKGTSLGKNISKYSFFSYDMNEALHLSQKERLIVIELFNIIKYELKSSIDKHSRNLITNNIELLLNYCVRFYDRQFIIREYVNKDILVSFERELDNYMNSEKPQLSGLPSVGYFAEKCNLSSNYFGDLIKKETGKSAQEFIQLKIIDIAKEKIFETGKTINEIAYELGFKYPQHFSRMFKKQTGYSPNEYRMMNKN